VSKAQPTFNQLLAQAIAEISATGYVNADQIAHWIDLLRNAAERELGPEGQIDRDTARRLTATFERLAERGKIGDYVPGVDRFTIAMVKPKLHAELDRRILASADLIKLHRKEAVERTLQRFQGWSTSIPPGGDGTIDKRETRSTISKSLAHYKYEKRRVDVDQGYKLIANISAVVAEDAGAIAGIWHDHGEHDPSYNARKEHMARSGRIYLVRGSWAHRDGLVKPVQGYMDEITAPGVEPFCRCWWQWITSPRRLPDEMLTRKGQEWVARGQQRAA
jgi:hypothetical protein